MSNVFKIHITTKTLSVFALTAILFGSFAPNIFAITAEEETELSKDLEINFIRSPVTRDVTPSIDGGHVDLELLLLVDVSGSVDGGEYTLQQNGYRDAFKDNSDGGVIDRILSSPNCIAVEYVHWARAATIPQVEIPWTKLCTEADSLAFADLINGVIRTHPGGATAPGNAINFGVTEFGDVFTSDRQVIDVSGDGIENEGDNTSDARDAALLAGVDTINGITIGTENDVHLWYPVHVVGGDDAFTKSVANFVDFTPAIQDKLRLEVCKDNCDPQTVGGESLNINMTSLFVTGFLSNALWIAPVAAGIAGTGLYLARSKIK